MMRQIWAISILYGSAVMLAIIFPISSYSGTLSVSVLPVSRSGSLAPDICKYASQSGEWANQKCEKIHEGSQAL